MRKSNWTPSIVPNEHDQTVYLVADDFKTGRVWREAEYDDTDLETVIRDLLTGQYNNPSRIVFQYRGEVVAGPSLRTSHKSCDDAVLQGRDIPFYLQDFTDRYEGRYHDVQLPLPMRLM
jgi:hypothetical protein